jgi:hypothetical protein
MKELPVVPRNTDYIQVAVAVKVDGLRAEVAFLALVEHMLDEVSAAVVFKQEELGLAFVLAGDDTWSPS